MNEAQIQYRRAVVRAELAEASRNEAAATTAWLQAAFWRDEMRRQVGLLVNRKAA